MAWSIGGGDVKRESLLLSQTFAAMSDESVETTLHCLEQLLEGATAMQSLSAEPEEESEE